MHRNKLRIGVDVDDVLYACNQHAIDLLAIETGLDPFNIHDVNAWGEVGGILDERLKYFSRADFVESQPILPGAQEFIKKLSTRGEVFIATAVGSSCMTARAERLIRDFPEIPERNIIIASRKDMLSLDILLDDGAHNILGTSASYPVLFRRPWNHHLMGLLAVNHYDDFLRLVDQIAKPFMPEQSDIRHGGVLCLVGPSGSRKTELAETLLADPRFEKPVTTTSRMPRDGEQGQYHFIDRKTFESDMDAGRFLETTVYGGQYYGATRDELDRIIRAGRIAIMPVDICGAITLKNAYPERCVLVFIDRPRRDVVRAIIEKDCPEDEKVLRILSLDAEYRNRDVCDELVSTRESVSAAADALKAMLRL